MERKKYIHIKKEDREFIERLFGVGSKTVFNALYYNGPRGDTDLAKKIRKVAMEHGGIVMNEIPEIETLHDSDGYIRQYLPNNTLLELDKHSGGCDVFHKGELVRHYDLVGVNQIGAVQEWAGALK